jgi:hypothetical protein
MICQTFLAPDAVLSQQQQQKTDSATNADTKSISSNSSSSSNKAAAASIDRSKLICKITYVALSKPIRLNFYIYINIDVAQIYIFIFISDQAAKIYLVENQLIFFIYLFFCCLIDFLYH